MSKHRHSQAVKRTHVVSSTPCRTRLRISQKRRTPEEMHRITAALKSQSNVRSVEGNLHTGSITIHHDHDPDAVQNLTATLKDLGVVLSKIVGVELPSDGKSEAASDLTGSLADLNQRVYVATNGLVDLRLLFPLMLGALSLRQLIRSGIQLEVVPWYVLAYYAFDSFIKLHYTQDTGAVEDQSFMSPVEPTTNNTSAKRPKRMLNPAKGTA